MTLSLSKRITGVVVVAAVAVLVAGMTGSDAIASNMGFKENKAIAAVGIPAPKGQNLVALPFNNPYANGQDICDALSLTPGSGQVLQVNAQTGSTNVHVCGNAPLFNLAERVGIEVRNPAISSGILVGSHAPGVAVTLYPLGVPAPKGRNIYPIPFHTTNANGQDVCNDLGLPNGSTVERIDATAGLTQSHVCGNTPLFNLVLGEALRVRYSGGGSLTPVPSHF